MNDLERKKAALERELARRQAKKSTSERQAAYVLGANRLLEAVIAHAEDRLDTRDDETRDEREHGVWGVDERERRELDGDATSRRQAARLTRGASSRGGV